MISQAPYKWTQENFTNGPIMGLSITFNNVFWDRERKVLKSWQRLFLQWHYTHLLTSKPATFSTTRNFTYKHLPTLHNLTFQSERRPFQLPFQLGRKVLSRILYSIPAFNVWKFEEIPRLFWSNVTFSSVICQYPLKSISHPVPLSKSRTASIIYGTKRRFTINPGVSYGK